MMVTDKARFVNDTLSLTLPVTNVGFESPTYTINEGNTTSVCLTLDRKLEKSISLNYALEAVMTFGNKK